jgi:HEPN domain-containing protein
MKREELVRHWMESSQQDFDAMERMYASGNYVWCLFVGHLVIEKLLKAHFVKKVGIEYPRIHDLRILAKQAGIELDDDRRKKLVMITAFNIEARYADIKYSFYKKATPEFTAAALDVIKETRLWLLENL